MISSQLVRSLLALSLVVPFTGCATDGEDLDDTEDSIDVDDSIDTPADLQDWSVLEVAGMPAGSVMVKQVTAAAAAGFPCPRDFACLYGNRNGGGQIVGVRTGFGLPDLRQLQFSDEASSWRNRAGRPYCWYRDINFNGPSHRMPAARQGNITGAPDNEASSYKPC